MRAVTFAIKLLEPMLVTGLEGDPNSVVSLDYIPGSVIRGMLISSYLQQRGQSQLDLSNDSECALFFNGMVRYLNAYPLALQAVINNQERRVRTLPTPLSWHILKDADEPDGSSTIEIHDLRFKSAEETFGDDPNRPLANTRPFFYYLKNQEVIAIKPEHRVVVHTQREPRKGRATEEEGAVFRYDSVAAGTHFGGVIVFDDKAKNELVSKIVTLLANSEIHLGRSRTGGYGRQKIMDILQQNNWQESAVKLPTTITKETMFTISLFSNALIRNEYGQYQVELSIEELQKYLGPIELCARGTYKRAEIVGGFNRKWGLPLPQTISLKAGSIFVFKALSDITQKQLQNLIDCGIGERRIEGFGRIAINLNSIDTLDWRAPEKEPLAVAPALPSDVQAAEYKLAKQIAERVLRQRLDTQLVKQINFCAIENAPPNSQITRLRAVLRNALYENSKQPVIRFFDQMRRTAQQHFDKAQVHILTGETSRLPNWITKTLNNLPLFDLSPIILGNENGVVQASVDALKLEYHLRLIDGVLARAAKESD